MVVLDTSALLRWTSKPDALSMAAIKAIEDSEQLIVSAISLWEIAWKTKLGKLALPVTTREFVTRLTEVENVEVLPVDTETWLRNVALDWAHLDPADRTIVATADLRGCPLVTSDRQIRAFYALAIW